MVTRSARGRVRKSPPRLPPISARLRPVAGIHVAATRCGVELTDPSLAPSDPDAEGGGGGWIDTSRRASSWASPRRHSSLTRVRVGVDRHPAGDDLRSDADPSSRTCHPPRTWSTRSRRICEGEAARVPDDGWAPRQDRLNAGRREASCTRSCSSTTTTCGAWPAVMANGLRRPLVGRRQQLGPAWLGGPSDIQPRRRGRVPVRPGAAGLRGRGDVEVASSIRQRSATRARSSTARDLTGADRRRARIRRTGSSSCCWWRTGSRSSLRAGTPTPRRQRPASSRRWRGGRRGATWKTWRRGPNRPSSGRWLAARARRRRDRREQLDRIEQVQDRGRGRSAFEG